MADSTQERYAFELVERLTSLLVEKGVITPIEKKQLHEDALAHASAEFNLQPQG